MLTDKTKAGREAAKLGVCLVSLCMVPQQAESRFWQRLNAARLWRLDFWQSEPEAFLVALADEVGRWNAKAIRAGMKLAVVLPEDIAFRGFRWAGREWLSIRQAFPLCDFRISGMR